MKSFFIIGMGALGKHLCREFDKNNCEMMVADVDPDTLDELLPSVVSAKVCDCTKPDVLKSFGVDEFDACFVCVEKDFQACLEITDLLKELGAKKVYSAANRDVEEKFLLRIGADRIIYPERDVAAKVAGLESARNIVDCINLSEEYSIYEIEPLKEWIGKTLIELDFRNRYHINIIALKKEERVIPIFRSDYAFEEGEHLLVLGHMNDIKRMLK